MQYPKSNLRQWWLFQDDVCIAKGILFSSGAGEVLGTITESQLTAFKSIAELYIAFPDATHFYQAF